MIDGNEQKQANNSEPPPWIMCPQVEMPIDDRWDLPKGTVLIKYHLSQNFGIMVIRQKMSDGSYPEGSLHLMVQAGITNLNDAVRTSVEKDALNEWLVKMNEFLVLASPHTPIGHSMRIKNFTAVRCEDKSVRLQKKSYIPGNKDFMAYLTAREAILIACVLYNANSFRVLDM